jgi:Family of unknown function (DUF5954)
VVREQFIRFGETGPEPARPADPDPGEPDQAREAPDPATGFVIDPMIPTGPSDGVLRVRSAMTRRVPRGHIPAGCCSLRRSWWESR